MSNGEFIGYREALAPTSGFWHDNAPMLDRADPVETALFLAQLDNTLRRLRASRLRFSIMRLFLVGAPDDHVAQRVVAQMADPHVMVGLWPDGSVVAAFFGPRPCGSAGDRGETRKIADRCHRALAEIGAAALIPRSRLLISHCWTDEVVDPWTEIERLDARHRRSD